MSPREKKRKEALLVGLGLDSKDEHIRITKGENFRLFGGSEETHEKMTETAIKFNENLSEKGKKISELEKEEFLEILSKSIVK